MTKPPRVGICQGSSMGFSCLTFLGRSRPRRIHFLKTSGEKQIFGQKKPTSGKIHFYYSRLTNKTNGWGTKKDFSNHRKRSQPWGALQSASEI